MDDPRVVSRDEWWAARRELLAEPARLAELSPDFARFWASSDVAGPSAGSSVSATPAPGR